MTAFYVGNSEAMLAQMKPHLDMPFKYTKNFFLKIQTPLLGSQLL